MNKILLIMCGVPGVGKSTWVREHVSQFKGTVKVVSRDAIRFSLVKENEEYFSKETEVFKIFTNEIVDGIHNYDVTIVDATHINEGSRSKLFRAISGSWKPKELEIDAIVLTGSLTDAINNNENRAGTRAYVPQSAIRRMYYQFELPVLEEGFNKILTYKNNELINIQQEV